MTPAMPQRVIEAGSGTIEALLENDQPKSATGVPPKFAMIPAGLLFKVPAAFDRKTSSELPPMSGGA